MLPSIMPPSVTPVDIGKTYANTMRPYSGAMPGPSGVRGLLWRNTLRKIPAGATPHSLTPKQTKAVITYHQVAGQATTLDNAAAKAEAEHAASTELQTKALKAGQVDVAAQHGKIAQVHETWGVHLRNAASMRKNLITKNFSAKTLDVLRGFKIE